MNSEVFCFCRVSQLACPPAQQKTRTHGPSTASAATLMGSHGGNCGEPSKAAGKTCSECRLTARRARRTAVPRNHRADIWRSSGGCIWAGARTAPIRQSEPLGTAPWPTIRRGRQFYFGGGAGGVVLGTFEGSGSSNSFLIFAASLARSVRSNHTAPWR
jgi:hypothetical protein